MRSCRPAKIKWAYESFTGAISSTAIMKAYKPYRQRVTVTLKRQVASGWVNAYATKTTGISSITDPMVLQTFFFMRRYSLPNFDLAGKESLRYKNHSMRIMEWQDKVDPPTVCLQISGCTAHKSVVNYSRLDMAALPPKQ